MRRRIIIVCILCLLLPATLVFSKDEPAEPTIAELAKQQELLNSALEKYGSPAKAKMLLALLANPFPEIRNGAMKALRELPACYKLNPTLETLPVNIPTMREYASAALGTFGAEEAILPLFQAVINDSYDKVRQNALNSLLKIAPKEKLINMFSDIIKHESCGPYHIRAAGTLGEIGLGSDIAVNSLVQRLEMIRIWPPGPRVHIRFGDMFTYIKDFDIIQAGGIMGTSAADPVVDTVYSGIVLDVRITRVEEFITLEREIICKALGNVTALAMGQDMARWISWWSAEKTKSLSRRYREQAKAIRQAEKEQGQDSFDIAQHLRLGHWCQIQKLEQEAAQEFTSVLAQEPTNESALEHLTQMGYVLHQDQWQPLGDIFTQQEKVVINLLNYLKFSYDPKQREEGLAKLEEIKPLYKLRPFIKTLQFDSVNDIRAYAAQELAATKELKVIPYLVKASLVDKDETVRTNAFNSLKQLGTRESIPWYIYFLESNPSASATIRASEILGQIGTRDERTIIALLRRMYRINLGNQAAQNISVPALHKTFTLDTDKKEKLLLGTVKIEMPDMQLTDIKTEKQLKIVSNALSKVTGKNFGTDYEQWIGWWQEYSSKK